MQRANHKKMIVWQNIDKLDIFTQNILKYIPRNEYKTKSQIDNASDSVGSNFVEGYYSDSLGEYIRFEKYAKRSLAELHERIRRLVRKEYINKNLYDEFDDLAIKTMYLFDKLITSLEKLRKKKQ